MASWQTIVAQSLVVVIAAGVLCGRAQGDCGDYAAHCDASHPCLAATVSGYTNWLGTYHPAGDPLCCQKLLNTEGSLCLGQNPGLLTGIVGVCLGDASASLKAELCTDQGSSSTPVIENCPTDLVTAALNLVGGLTGIYDLRLKIRADAGLTAIATICASANPDGQCTIAESTPVNGNPTSLDYLARLNIPLGLANVTVTAVSGSKSTDCRFSLNILNLLGNGLGNSNPTTTPAATTAPKPPVFQNCPSNPITVTLNGNIGNLVNNILTGQYPLDLNITADAGLASVASVCAAANNQQCTTPAASNPSNAPNSLVYAGAVTAPLGLSTVTVTATAINGLTSQCVIGLNVLNTLGATVGGLLG